MNPGDKLGAYQIESLLGMGGMGEVYRATDPRLGRDVAIKILSPALASNAETIARFEREARLLASLNHSGIASIYGFEREGSTPFLVLEYVPGQTLAELAGKLDEDDIARYALQIVDALEAAHEKGIVHRDLKPANIKITPEGKVKVLDFGLAKALTEDAASPTISASQATVVHAFTRVGTIMGTPAYMSPEQARGKVMDKRTDIWAFGAVVYEMVSGKPAFPGDNVADILSSVVKAEPDWTCIPSHWQRLLKICLKKDPAQRLRDIGDARLLLQGAPEVPPQKKQIARLSWILLPAGIAMGALLTVGVSAFRRPVEAPRPVARFLISENADAAAISPDGNAIAWRGMTPDGIRLFTRNLADSEPRNYAEPGAGNMSFSPDGRSLARVSARGLFVLSLETGTQAAVNAPSTLNGAIHWSGPAAILYKDNASSGLYEASLQGAAPRKIADKDLLSPYAIPDSDWILGVEISEGSPAGASVNGSIVSLHRRSGEIRRNKAVGMKPRFMEPGFVVYAHAGGLYAMPLDRSSMTLSADPVRVLEDVGNWDVSRSGSLIYQARGQDQIMELVVTTREGRTSTLGKLTEQFSQISLSPDGSRILVSRNGSAADVWMHSVERGVMTRVTTEPVEDEHPVWSPDGKRFVYASQRGGVRMIAIRQADGSPGEEIVYTGKGHTHTYSWSANGKHILFSDQAQGNYDLWLATHDGASWKAKPWHASQFRDTAGAISPDGKWVAYNSGASGDEQLYVRPLDGPGRWQVSATPVTGTPVWSSNGRELHFVSQRKMMVVAITPGVEFQPGKPKEMFTVATASNFAVTKDGSFLYLQPEQANVSRRLYLVQNWVEEVKQKFR